MFGDRLRGQKIGTGTEAPVVIIAVIRPCPTQRPKRRSGPRPHGSDVGIEKVLNVPPNEASAAAVKELEMRQKMRSAEAARGRRGNERAKTAIPQRFRHSIVKFDPRVQAGDFRSC